MLELQSSNIISGKNRFMFPIRFCTGRKPKSFSGFARFLKFIFCIFSVCVYSMGGFLDILPAHQGTMDIKKIEEFGNRFKYK